MVEFYRSQEYKAKKPHTCFICGGKIDVGDRYWYSAWKDEGEISTTHAHLKCQKIVNEFCDWADESEYDIDEVYDWWRDNKCTNCRHFYIDDCEHCEFYEGDSEACNNSHNGKCMDGDTCYLMNMYCWCTKYSPEEKNTDNIR